VLSKKKTNSSQPLAFIKNQKLELEELIKNIEKSIKVSLELKRDLISNFKLVSFEKGKLIVKEGQYNVNLFYISKGILRCFNLKDGKDITNDFFFENTFVTDYGSLLNNSPAGQNFEVIENSDIYRISKEKLFDLVNKYPELKIWGGKMAENLFAQSIIKQSIFKSNTPKERYLSILKEKPEIIQKIPLSLVASYLGITQVHLSRIRKSLS